NFPGSAKKPQGWLAAAGAHARLMRLPGGRLHAKTTAVRSAHPTQGTMLEAPGSLPQGLSLVTSPVATGGVTDHRQGKLDVTFLRTLQGIGGPGTLFFGSQRRGAGGALRRGGLFPAFDRWHDAGPCPGAQVLDHPHAVKAPVEPQELHT